MEAVSFLILLSFCLGDVKFSGNYFFPDSVLKKCFSFSRFDTLSLHKGIDCVLDLYENAGFPYVRVRVGNFEKRGDTVSFTVFIVEGRREKVEEIEVEGNVRKEAIVELLGIKKGDYFSGKKLREGIERLEAEKLQVEEYGLRKGDGGVVVFVKVNEKRKNYLRGFVGYAMEEGFSGFLEIRGGGEFSRFGEIGGMWSREGERQRLYLSGTFPWRRFELSSGIFYELPDTLTSFLRLKAKGGVRAGRFLFFAGIEGWEKSSLGKEKEEGKGWIMGSEIKDRFLVETYRGERYYRINLSFFLPFLSGGYEKSGGDVPDFSLFRPGDKIRGFSPENYSSTSGVWFSLHPHIFFFIPLLEGAYMEPHGFIWDFGFGLKFGDLTLTYAIPFGKNPLLGRVRVEVEK